MSDLSSNLAYCYQLLGLKTGATKEEIKSVYRRLVQQCHPDHNSGSQESEERFKEISRVYRLLLEHVQQSQPCTSSASVSKPVSAPCKTNVRIYVRKTTQETSPHPPSRNPTGGLGLKYQLLQKLNDYLRNGKWQQVVQTIEEQPLSLQQDSEIRHAKAKAYHAEARNLARCGQYEQALSYIEKALETDPNKRDFWQEIKKAYLLIKS